MKPTLNIILSEEHLWTLKTRSLVRPDTVPSCGPDSNAGVNRARYWLVRCNCAILSAWRSRYSREQNDIRNLELQQRLRQEGYGVIGVRGRYAETGRKISTENSFLVFDFKQKPAETFFESIRSLSELYEQDSFLFKEAGEEKPAFVYGTNDDFGRGRKELLGPLHIGSRESGAFSSLRGSGFFFE